MTTTRALFAVLLTALVGCSGLSHRKDEAAVSHVKRVAVVAMSVYEPASAGIGLNLNSGKLHGTAGGSLIPQTDAHVDTMYTEFGKAFEKNLGWQVMGRDQMTGNKGYIIAYDRTMKGFQNKMPPGEGMKQFNVTKVMDFDGPRILDFAGREALIQALKVDAIIVGRMQVFLSGTTVMGIGSRHPQTQVMFNMYSKGVEQPIWFEGNLQGDEMESVGKTGFIDEKLLGELALKSAKTAFAKIGTDSSTK
jgi:hypothetical protein